MTPPIFPPIVDTTAGVTLVGGGALQPDDWRDALSVAPLLVAADGGADAALCAGHMPDAVIGDFDSISAAAMTRIPRDRRHRVAEQDSTDFEKCLARISARFVIAIGFSGNRLDHTLAVLSAMARVKHSPVLMLAESDVVFLAPAELSLDLQAGTRVSLWPLGPVRGTSTGLRWPIEDIDFAPSGPIGTSNEATGAVTLSLDGPMLVILCRSMLSAALRTMA